MYNFANASAPPYTPTMNTQDLPSQPANENAPLLSASPKSLLTYYRDRSINKGDVTHDNITTYESMDDAIERYKKNTLIAILALAGFSVGVSMIGLYCLFVGFTFLPSLALMIQDPHNEEKTNLTFTAVSIGTMVALYQTDAMKQIMNATIPKMDVLFPKNWEDMSNTTQQFMTFNVALTLSVLAGFLAHVMVSAAIEAKDQHSRNKMKM